MSNTDTTSDTPANGQASDRTAFYRECLDRIREDIRNLETAEAEAKSRVADVQARLAGARSVLASIHQRLGESPRTSPVHQIRWRPGGAYGPAAAKALAQEGKPMRLGQIHEKLMETEFQGRDRNKVYKNLAACLASNSNFVRAAPGKGWWGLADWEAT